MPNVTEDTTALDEAQGIRTDAGAHGNTCPGLLCPAPRQRSEGG